MEMPRYYGDVVAFTGVTVNPLIELTELPSDRPVYFSSKSPQRAGAGTIARSRPKLDEDVGFPISYMTSSQFPAVNDVRWEAYDSLG